MATCRLLPQGSYPLIPMVLTTMGWLASLFQDDCDYTRVEGDAVALIAANPNVPWLEMGIQAYREPQLVNGEWQVRYGGRCLEYPDDAVLRTTEDPYWKASKAFSFLALVLGGGGTFFLWFCSCCVFSRGTWKWAGYEVGLASIFQAASFCFFSTELCKENDCELFWGSRSDIAAAVLWFTTAVCIFIYYPPAQSTNEDEEVEEEDGIMVVDDSMRPPTLEDADKEASDKTSDQGQEQEVLDQFEKQMTSGQDSQQETPAEVV